MTKPYYPIQIPYLLSEKFQRLVAYQEEQQKGLQEFVICYWQMTPMTQEQQVIENIIIADGCIDLVVAFDQQQIGFSGMRATDFQFIIPSNERFMGLRFKPGAFSQLFQLPAARGMDQFFPLEALTAAFDCSYFFQLPFEAAKSYLLNWWLDFLAGKQADFYTQLFDVLTEDLPESATALYNVLKLKERSCQRLFQEKYALSPKKVLSILRFQKGLQELLQATEPAVIGYYYDQSHFIQDFKKNIGITPKELIQHYR